MKFSRISAQINIYVRERTGAIQRLNDNQEIYSRRSDNVIREHIDAFISYDNKSRYKD